MIFEIIAILFLMIIDFPFTVAPATAWGLIIGLDTIQLGVMYILACLFSGLFFYLTMRNKAKKFKTWKIIARYKSKSQFFSIFIANLLTHNFDTAAAASDHKINIFITLLALSISNAIYFLTVWGIIALVTPLFTTNIMKIFISLIVVSVIWTAIAHPISYKLGFGW